MSASLEAVSAGVLFAILSRFHLLDVISRLASKEASNKGESSSSRGENQNMDWDVNPEF